VRELKHKLIYLAHLHVGPTSSVPVLWRYKKTSLVD